MAEDKGGPLPPPKPQVTETGTLFRTSLHPHVTPALSATATGTDSAAPSSSGWQVTNPSQWESNERVVLSEGSVLKQRFVLERIVGKGGMGTVFAARDLRKEEAQDRFPYVAVKIINEDFKRHPESLKLLQREARKAQQLAHPNIVAVHDFDRDGANVFIVMELLQGESLDRVIKACNGKGLPQKDALRIAGELGQALSYAHQKGVIHLDFKPANAYIAKSGDVKVLDFGIAQAQQREDAPETDQTRFQVSDLGALTPSYASLEMQEGADPDPRDDVYALACVTYELLSGKHPFGRQSAQFALEYKLSPTRPKGLSRSRWQGLQRGLALKRGARTPSIAEFVAELKTDKTSPLWRWSLAAAAAATVVGAVIHWQLRVQVGAPKVASTLERSASLSATPVDPASESQTPALSPKAPEQLPSAQELVDIQRKRLLRLAAANEVAESTEMLNDFREELPAGDSFVDREAPQAIAAAYLRLAERALAKADYAQSSDSVSAAQRLVPNQERAERLQAVISAVTNLDAKLRTEPNLTTQFIRSQLALVKDTVPNSYAMVESNLASVLAARIQREQRAGSRNVAVLLAVATEIFGHVPAVAALAPATPQVSAQQSSTAASVRQTTPTQVTPQAEPPQSAADASTPAQSVTTQTPSAPPEDKPKKKDRPNVIVTF